MRIAILGAGHVGATLGRRWVETGHDIYFGVRAPNSPKYLELIETIGGESRAGTVHEAAAASDIVLLATPWRATELAILEAGDLSKKIVLDATNPLKDDLSGLEPTNAASGGEQIAQWSRSPKVVKIFNTTGYENMADPSYGGKPVTMLYAGDDREAKRIASDLAREIGFEPFDAGPLANARWLEGLALLWVHLAYQRGLGTGFAINVERRA